MATPSKSLGGQKMHGLLLTGNDPLSKLFKYNLLFSHIISNRHDFSFNKDFDGNDCIFALHITAFWIQCWQCSWNSHWGENGTFRIRKGTNECGIVRGVILPFHMSIRRPSPSPPICTIEGGLYCIEWSYGLTRNVSNSGTFVFCLLTILGRSCCHWSF